MHLRLRRYHPIVGLQHTRQRVEAGRSLRHIGYNRPVRTFTRYQRVSPIGCAVLPKRPVGIVRVVSDGRIPFNLIQFIALEGELQDGQG